MATPSHRTRIIRVLAGLGFQPLRPSTHACRGGELVHVVDLRKDRHGGLMLTAAVWHPVFADADADNAGAEATFAPDGLVFPIAACLSPRGFIANWTWPGDTLAPEHVEALLPIFFAGFRTLDDVRVVVAGGWLPPAQAAALARPADAATGAIPARIATSATYPVVGGAPTPAQVDRTCRDFLARLLGPLGFVAVPGEDVVAIRERGALVDCVRLLPDEFGTFAALVCYPGTRRVWAADKRWKGTYYPFIESAVEVDGRPWAVPVRALDAVDLEALRVPVREVLAGIAGRIDSVDAFIAALGSDWGTLAASLRRIAPA